MTKAWRIDSAKQSLVLATRDRGLAEVVYWGAPLPANEDLPMLVDAAVMDVTGGMLDTNPPISIAPEATRSFPGQVGMRLRDLSGAPIEPRLRFVDAHAGGDALFLNFVDADFGLRYRASFRVDGPSGLIIAEASLHVDVPIYVDWLAAPVLPVAARVNDVIDFAGRWCGEFREIRTPIQSGARLRANPTGRTGHEHFPATILPVANATHCQGHVFALHYGWSGGHQMIVEELPDGRRQIQFGHMPGSMREPLTRVMTAPLYLAYSDAGLNGCAIAFQRHLRAQMWARAAATMPRPVHYNCWEAVYFDHKPAELIEIASRAAALGAERFVLDDGWFGRRNDDTSSLGDWVVDRRKYPDGLDPLIGHIRGLGMRFGIWFEPEMVNEDSDLYRAHPEWVLGRGDQIRGRQQRVLDMARAEVQDYLFDAIAAMLGGHKIDYIKWDHNRVLPHADAAQTHGTYALLARLRAAFPKVEIESCASGGGRIDFGILAHTERVWLSDSNDAMERARIQHGAAAFLPAMVMGSHVGPRQSHTSGRILNMAYRAWIAAQRHMGFEMDPRELTADEAATLRARIAWWKLERAWMHDADLVRLDTNDAAVLGEMHIAPDRSRFLLFANRIDSSAQILPRPIAAYGLEPSARYHINLVNRDEAVGLSRGAAHLKFDDLVLSGRYLMSQGINLPWSFAHQVWVLKGERLE